MSRRRVGAEIAFQCNLPCQPTERSEARRGSARSQLFEPLRGENNGDRSSRRPVRAAHAARTPCITCVVPPDPAQSWDGKGRIDTNVTILVYIDI